MRVRNLSHETELGIITDYESGMTVRGIRAKYTISGGLLYSILNRYNVTRTRGYQGMTEASLRRLSLAEKKQIVNERFKGEHTIEYLMDKWNLNKSALYTILDNRESLFRQDDYLDKLEGVIID